jgi:tetratricopeptide (TPR) repeat protein
MSTTHPGLARAQALIEIRRYRLAEEELRRALGDEPQNAVLHAYLALCLAEDPARVGEAMQEALWATAHDPLLPTGWYVLSMLQSRRGMPFEAEKTARIALGLAPDLPPLLLHLARLMMARERFRDGLEFAERALSVTPHDPQALMTAGSLRSRMGRHAEAEADFARAVALAPDDPAVQGNAGWAALRRGYAAAALGHFRVSLQREPGEQSAQHGLLEALRARNPVYRGFLRVALRVYWMPPFMKWVAIAVGVAAAAYAGLLDLPRPMWLAVQAAIIAAAVFTWTARPLADLLMLSDPAGRAVLEPAQKVAAVGVTVLLAASVTLGFAWAVGAPRGTGMAAIFALLFTVPLTAAPRMPPGRWRLVLAGYSALVAAAAALAVMHHATRANDAASTWFGLAIGGLCMTDIIAELVPRPRR